MLTRNGLVKAWKLDMSPKINSNQHQVWTNLILKHSGCPWGDHAWPLHEFKPVGKKPSGNLIFERIYPFTTSGIKQNTPKPEI